MAAPYTHGVWQVKPGLAGEFVEAWTEFADWSSEQAPGAGWAKLLRDLDDPNRFFTFGPLASLEAIAEWRGLAGWSERIARIRPLLEDFRPSTLEVVVERG